MSYSDDYEKQTRKMAHKAFADHKLRSSSDGRWLIQRQREDGSWDGTFATEIICLFNASLYVGGDIDVVVFSYGPKEHDARLCWIGRQSTGTYYLAQKAAVGTGGRDMIMKWDEDCARDELKRVLEDEDIELDDVDREKLQECLDCVSDGQHEVFSNLPYDAWEYLGGEFGMVLSSKVLYAQAAVAKLCELLGFDQPQETEA